MAPKTDVLKNIVALKRQGAEQRVQVLQLEIELIAVSIDVLAAGLKALDESRAGFDAHRLAEANGHTGRVIRDMNLRRAALEDKRSELHEARERLKRVFHSQERLGEVVPKR